MEREYAHRFRRVSAATTLLLAALIPLSPISSAQSPSSSLPETLRDLSTAALSQENALGVRSITPPILLSSDFPSLGVLQFLEAPPSLRDVAVAGNTTIQNALRSIVNSVEIGTPELTAAESAAVDQANGYLYLDVDARTPSNAYSTYLSFHDQYEAASSKLSNATSSAEKATLETTLARLERDWLLFGFRAEVEAALETIQKFDHGKVLEEFDSWKSQLEADTPHFADLVENAFTSSQWIRVESTLSSALVSRVRASVVDQGTRRDVEFRVPISSVSFDLLVVPLRKDFLDHPFMTSDRWRLSGTVIVSDGDIATSTDQELLNAVIGSVYLIKNIEVHMAQNIDAPIVKTLARARSASVDGMTVRQELTGSLFITPRSLALYGPFVIAVSIEAPRKTPNPSQNLKW